MKTLKFADNLVPLVLSGEKTSTWRLFDDKDLRVGDELQLLKKDGEVVSAARIVSVREKKLGEVEAADFEGHERYESPEKMLATLKTYYGPQVTWETPVKMIGFDLVKKDSFSGDKKVGASLLNPLERRFINWAVTRVPKAVETYHLTLATIPICGLLILFSFLAVNDIRWLWGMSAMIALQWLTDSLDGAVGRLRRTGLVRWGYYMDHLLDYFFLAALMLGYMILLPDKSKWAFFFVFGLFAGYMVNSFLVMAATNKFRIVHLGIGPTEVRLLFIVVNTLLIAFGKTYLVFVLPYTLGAAFLGLLFIIYREQKLIWALDMEGRAVERRKDS